jgi:hypothetical protein
MYQCVDTLYKQALILEMYNAVEFTLTKFVIWNKNCIFCLHKLLIYLHKTNLFIAIILSILYWILEA